MQKDRAEIFKLLEKYRKPDVELTGLNKKLFPYFIRPSVYRFGMFFARKEDRDLMEKWFSTNAFHVVKIGLNL